MHITLSNLSYCLPAGIRRCDSCGSLLGGSGELQVGFGECNFPVFQSQVFHHISKKFSTALCVKTGFAPTNPVFVAVEFHGDNKTATTIIMVILSAITPEST